MKLPGAPHPLLRCGALRRLDSSSQPSTPIRHSLERHPLLLDAGDVADGAAGGAGGECGIALEGLRDLAVAIGGLPCGGALRLHGGAALGYQKHRQGAKSCHLQLNSLVAGLDCNEWRI